MEPAHTAAIIAAALFFLNGLLTGVSRFGQIAASPGALTQPYADIARRTSLLYSYAAILLAKFAETSQLPATIDLVTMIFLLANFAITIITSMIPGDTRKPDNQYKEASPAVLWGM